MLSGIRPFFRFVERSPMVPQFFLITPAIDDLPAFRVKLAPLIETGALAVILAKTGPDSDARRLAAALREPIQKAGIALLIDCPDDARAIARLGFDGAHVARPGLGLAEAISTLKPDRIVGIGGLRARHDAMEAGEKDIDYVMFGEPRADGFVPPVEQTVERAEWWASIFNVPCVAYAPDMAGVALLAATGVEFIAIGPWLFDHADPAGALAEARRLAKARATGIGSAG